MFNKFKGTVLGLGLAAMASAGSVQAAVLDLSSNWYYTYGNTNSYSLPILAYQYNALNGGGVGPGNPYYVDSTPGAIKDLVVIYTGSNGTGVTTNVAGIEDAFGVPNGSTPTFATTLGTGVAAPTGTASKGIATIYETTWDASLSSLKTFLDGGTPLFLFNNNDTRQDENLAIWAKLWITSDVGGTVYNDRYLYLGNVDPVTGARKPYGMGGVPMGDATTYNPGDIQPGFGIDPLTGLPVTDYVLSGGDICVDSLGVTDPACGPGTTVIKHNLGANQVAYAADLPLLNTWLGGLFNDGNIDLSQYSLHLQLNLGCDPILSGVTTVGSPNGKGKGKPTSTAAVDLCANFKIDNGYEQLFLASSKYDHPVIPEPTSVALFGLALAGLAVATRRKAG